MSKAMRFNRTGALIFVNAPVKCNCLKRRFPADFADQRRMSPRKSAKSAGNNSARLCFCNDSCLFNALWCYRYGLLLFQFIRYILIDKIHHRYRKDHCANHHIA
jgi:hypothetical protein